MISTEKDLRQGWGGLGSSLVNSPCRSRPAIAILPISGKGRVVDDVGEYALESSGQGTRVTYRTTIEPAIPMIGFVKRQAEKTIINTALVGLKKRVEAR